MRVVFHGCVAAWLAISPAGADENRTPASTNKFNKADFLEPSARGSLGPRQLIAAGAPRPSGDELARHLADAGLTARVVPARVFPGDLFELLVEMDRPEFARFALRVPEQDRLHRVAVESAAVVLEAGRYRQRERWLLQADASGDIVIDGASLVLSSARGETTLALPPLRVTVVAYGKDDGSDEPLVLPERGIPEGSSRMTPWWGLVPPVLVVLGIMVWIRRSRRDDGQLTPGADDLVGPALRELDAGRLTSSALERLITVQGTEWPTDLHQAVGQAVYAGRGEASRLAGMLRKELAG